MWGVFFCKICEGKQKIAKYFSTKFKFAAKKNFENIKRGEFMLVLGQDVKMEEVKYFLNKSKNKSVNCMKCRLLYGCETWNHANS